MFLLPAAEERPLEAAEEVLRPFRVTAERLLETDGVARRAGVLDAVRLGPPLFVLAAAERPGRFFGAADRRRAAVLDLVVGAMERDFSVFGGSAK